MVGGLTQSNETVRSFALCECSFHKQRFGGRTCPPGTALAQYERVGPDLSLRFYNEFIARCVVVSNILSKECIV